MLKKNQREVKCSVDLNTFTGTPSEIMDKMNEAISSTMEMGYEEPRFDYSYYGAAGGVEFSLYYTRLETSKERASRLAKEKEEREKKRTAEERRKEKELATYLKLKEKYA